MTTSVIFNFDWYITHLLYYNCVIIASNFVKIQAPDAASAWHTGYKVAAKNKNSRWVRKCDNIASFASFAYLEEKKKLPMDNWVQVQTDKPWQQRAIRFS